MYLSMSFALFNLWYEATKSTFRVRDHPISPGVFGAVEKGTLEVRIVVVCNFDISVEDPTVCCADALAVPRAM